MPIEKEIHDKIFDRETMTKLIEGERNIDSLIALLQSCKFLNKGILNNELSRFSLRTYFEVMKETQQLIGRLCCQNADGDSRIVDIFDDISGHLAFFKKTQESFLDEIGFYSFPVSKKDPEHS